MGELAIVCVMFPLFQLPCTNSGIGLNLYCSVPLAVASSLNSRAATGLLPNDPFLAYRPAPKVQVPLVPGPPRPPYRFFYGSLRG